MRITAADHINIRVKDPEATIAFYQGVLGLEPDRLEDFRAGKRPLFAFRVNESFILHVFPDPDFNHDPGGGYDHLALTVEATTPDALVVYLEKKGVAVERQMEQLWGARGEGWACYIRDPDGYRVELKIYPP
jgi:lactoylglutathione lyase